MKYVWGGRGKERGGRGGRSGAHRQSLEEEHRGGRRAYWGRGDSAAAMAWIVFVVQVNKRNGRGPKIGRWRGAQGGWLPGAGSRPGCCRLVVWEWVARDGKQ